MRPWEGDRAMQCHSVLLQVAKWQARSVASAAGLAHPSLVCGGADETEQLALAGTARAALLVRGVWSRTGGTPAGPRYLRG